MGAKSVSSLQYNVEDLEEALYHVNVADYKGNSGTASISFHLSPSSSHAGTDKEQGDAAGLRHRNPPSSQDLSPDVETLSSEEDGFEVVKKKPPKEKKDEDTASEGDCLNSRKDPIKWFGVLVPQALKQSQERFKRAVHHTCVIAFLQSKLVNIKTQFRELQARKDQILNDLPGQDDDMASLTEKKSSPIAVNVDMLKNED